MKLGILVNTDRHPEDLAGIVNAAIAKGHEVTMFFMDDGVKLLNAPMVKSLAENAAVDMSYCDYSTQRIGMSTDGVSDSIDCGSQFNNAMMNQEADRVIVL